VLYRLAIPDTIIGVRGCFVLQTSLTSDLSKESCSSEDEGLLCMTDDCERNNMVPWKEQGLDFIAITLEQGDLCKLQTEQTQQRQHLS
jgi:hypothetical protein